LGDEEFSPQPANFRELISAMTASATNSENQTEPDCEEATQALIEQLERQQALLQSLLGQIDILISAADEHELLDVVCTQLLASGLFSGAWLGRMPARDAEAFDVLAAGSNGRDVLDAFTAEQTAIFCRYLVRAQFQDETIIEDADHSLLTAPWQPFAPRGFDSSIFFIPIHRLERPWAVLVVILQHEGPLEALISGTLRRLGELIGNALAQLDLRQRLSNEHEETAYLAYHDALTGLANRRFLDEELPKALARAVRNNRSLAVVMLDLDDFKPINDRYGHAVGDELLKTLATRIRQVLRSSDLAVRQGGDEFILLIEGIESISDLVESLKRIHRSLSEPYVLQQTSSRIQTSMGVTVFPQDDAEPDQLIRHADAALYASKDHKHDRTCPWHWWNDEIDETDGNLQAKPNLVERTPPYGSAASDLLRTLAESVNTLAETFVARFYQELSETDPASAKIVGWLGPEEYAHLQRKQTEHLKFLLSPSLTEEEHRAQARIVGGIHALTGVSASSMVRAITIYLHQFDNSAPKFQLGRQDLIKLETVITERLSTELAEELEAEQAINQQFQSNLVKVDSLSRSTLSWQDFNEHLLQLLCTLPAIEAGWIGSPSEEGPFVVNFAHHSEEIATALAELEGEVRLASIFENISSDVRTTELAFRTGQVQTIDSFSTHRNVQTWQTLAKSTGIRSSVSIPILDAQRHPIAVLTLYGSYPGMFETPFRQSFCQQIGFVVSQTWQQFNRTQTVTVSIQELDLWRQAFYGDGIRFVYQPIIDLKTGHLDKVEALARLEMPDGRTIMPGQFIPRLNESQIIHLFRKGLDIGLAQLAQWDRDQTTPLLGLSLNLPLEALAHPECHQWVADALTQHHVAAPRLDLEVLEHGEIHEIERSARHMNQLAQLGVGLTMDDLGSGYSSLIRLNNLPFDTIKIDQALIRSAYNDPPRIIKFISALIHMAHALDLSVVVEGLEHPDLIEAARILGADMGQGYGLSYPLPPEQLSAWVHSRVPPPDLDFPQTAMGAIATHWQRVNYLETPNQSAGDGHYNQCPVHRFIVYQQLEGSALDAAHQALHAAKESHSAQYQYLLKQVQSLLAELVVRPEPKIDPGTASGAASTSVSRP
jgi:diguanylate cyclase (GGDEF)-like protein